MADDILLGVKIDAQKAISELAKLEEELGTTIDKSRGLVHAFAEAQELAEKKARALAFLKDKAGAAEEKVRSLGVSARGLRDAFGAVLGVVGGTAAAVGGFAFGALRAAAAAEQHQRALAQLGTAYAAVERATQGTVTAEQALRAQQTLVQSGLRVSADELATITRRARDYALATGTETTAALDQFVDALKGGEAEGLQRFGVAVRQNEGATRTFHRALGELGQQFRRDAPAARTMAEELAALSTNSTNLVGSLATLATSALGLGGVLQWVNQQLVSLREVADMMGSRDATNARGERRQNVSQAFNSRVAMLNARGHRLGVRADQLSQGDLEWATNRLMGSFTSQAQVDEFRTELQRRAAATRGRNNSPFGLPGAGGDAGTDRRPPPAASSGGGRNRPAGESYDEAVRRIDEGRRVTWDAQERLDAQYAEERARRQREAGRAAYYSPAAAAQRAAADGALMRRAGQPGRAQQEFDRRFDFGAQMSSAMEAFAPAAARTQTVAENLSQTVTSAFGKMANAAGEFFGALMAGEDAGAAFQKIVHELFKSIAMEATAKALLAGAEGLFRIARSYGADPTGYALLANAGMWAGVAAATGVVAGVTAPARAGGAAGIGAGGMGANAASMRPAQLPSAGEGGGGGNTFVINVSGTQFAPRQTQEAVVAALDQASRSGMLQGSHFARSIR